MAAFRKIVARRGFEDALSGVVRSGGLIVVDWPDDAVGVVVDSWLDDLVFRDDLTVDVDSVEFYPIEKMVDGLFEVVGWQFCADGHVLFDSFRDEDED